MCEGYGTLSVSVSLQPSVASTLVSTMFRGSSAVPSSFTEHWTLFHNVRCWWHRGVVWLTA